MKRIKISPQARRAMEERWPHSTIITALYYRRNSALAKEIRRTAIEHFGGMPEDC